MNDKMVEALLATSPVEYIPGNVGVSQHAEFSKPTVDRGPFWARVLDRFSSAFGPATLGLLGFVLDRMDEAIEAEEREAQERELEAAVKQAYVHGRLELARSPQVAWDDRIRAAFEIFEAGFRLEATGLFEELEAETSPVT